MKSRMVVRSSRCSAREVQVHGPSLVGYRVAAGGVGAMDLRYRRPHARASDLADQPPRTPRPAERRIRSSPRALRVVPAAGDPDPPPPIRAELARFPRRGARRQPDGHPAAAPRARGGRARQPCRREARRRPAATRVRRHTGRAGPLPDRLRGLRLGPGQGDRGGRGRRPRRGGVRSPAAPDRRPGPRRMAERLPDEASLEDRVRVLAGLQDEAGYLAEALVDDDG